MSCTIRYGNVAAIGLIAIAGLMFMATGSVSASPVNDAAEGVNDVLFGGNNLYAAKTILTAAVMMSAGLLLAMMRMPSVGIFIILFCVLGALTAIGWADITFLLVASLIAAALFAKAAVEYTSGGGSTAEPPG